ncbi:MAG: type II toxin-antitoxin system RelE/ParE family toxin [Bacteroidales bacterium]|nr:type II toxin-antitoxin system RelE/ParE family toxin [Bacteroidales bacterium]
MKTISWTDLALADYHKNIDYLLKEWSEKVALTFIDDVDAVLVELKRGKVEFKESNYKNIRECVVCKQITLYYRHINKDKIELLRFWNNYQDDKKLKL